MKKQLVIIGIVVSLIIVGLSGCDSLKSDNDKFIGTWKVNDATSINEVTNVFFSNGTSTFSGVSCKWEIKDGLLVIITPDLSTQSTFSYGFSKDDSMLILTPIGEGITIVMIKQ
jgi:hypothetical protein